MIKSPGPMIVGPRMTDWVFKNRTNILLIQEPGHIGQSFWEMNGREVSYQ